MQSAVSTVYKNLNWKAMPTPDTVSYLENQQHTIPFSYQRISSWLIQNNSFQGGGGVRVIFVNQMSFFKKGNFLKSKYMSSNEK